MGYVLIESLKMRCRKLTLPDTETAINTELKNSSMEICVLTCKYSPS